MVGVAAVVLVGGVLAMLGQQRGKGGPVVRGFGLLGIIPNITGILSDRIRTDSVDNFVSDMLRQPIQEDLRKYIEE